MFPLETISQIGYRTNAKLNSLFTYGRRSEGASMVTTIRRSRRFPTPNTGSTGICPATRATTIIGFDAGGSFPAFDCMND